MKYNFNNLYDKMIIQFLNQSRLDDLFMAFWDSDGGSKFVFSAYVPGAMATVPGVGNNDLDLCTSPRSNNPN